MSNFILPGCIVICSLILIVQIEAKELDDSRAAIESGRDWRYSERSLWDVQSRQLEGEPLMTWVKSNPNNFFTAALGNTHANRPGEYVTVRQRHSYYDYMSLYLEYGEHDLPTLRDIRFFHAATSITIQGELGMADSLAVPILEDAAPGLAKQWGVNKDSIGTLVETNKRLFAKNMDVIRRLTVEWKEPRDPRAIKPREALDALAFDLAMVEFEQGEVEDYLTERSVSNARIADITKIIERGSVVPQLGMVRQVTPWVKKAGFTTPDFGNKGWRIAVGRALVFLFHKKSEDEYQAYMQARPVKNVPRVSFYDGLQAPSEISREASGNFTVVGSWRTEAGAMRHLADLRSRYRGIHAAVFPPYGRSRYWFIGIASFAPADTARELAVQAQRGGLAPDAYVLRLHPVDPVGRTFSVAPRSVEVSIPAGLIEAGPVGPDEDKPVVPDPESAGFLSVFRSPDLAAAQAFYRDWQVRFPQVEFALYQLGSVNTYDVVLAAFANRNQIDAALDVARRIGLPEASIQITQARAEEQVARLGEQGRAATAAWEKVTSCYKQGHVTAEALHTCSGLWMTPKTLTRCFLKNNCRGLGDDILTTPEEVEAFLRANGIGEDGKIKLEVAGLPIPTDAQVMFNGITNCRTVAAGQEAAFVNCMTTQLGQAANAQALSCLSEGMSNEAAVSCLVDAGALPNLDNRVECFRGDLQDERSVALCLAGPEQAGAIGTAEACLTASKGENEALSECLTNFVPEQERALVSCLSEQRDSPDRAALCTLGDSPDAQKAVAAFECVERRAGSNEKVAACLAELVGGDAGKVLQCGSQGGDEAKVVACMLEGNKELKAAQTIYACATGGTSAAELVANCNGGLLSGDAQKVAACVAEQGSSNEQIAACAATALLPKDLAPVAACAMKSQGGVGVALCVAAPSMNEEWRIASECAASTGGEPFSFAGCTAGRLTLKEFQQCLSGDRTKCFGEGNTIVQAFKTVSNDLANCLGGRRCLGKNNDIVKFAEGVEEAVQDVGEGLEKLGQAFFGERSDFCRSDLTGWACRL